MHYGLSHLEDSFHADNLYKVVHLAPCFYPHVPNWTKLFADHTVMQFQNYGIYAINGPNWTRDLQTICDNFPLVICDYAKSITGSQPQSVKSEQYWLTNGLTNRFQEFPEHWLDGETETDLVDVSRIRRVPMAFFTATHDEVCQHKVASKYIAQIQSDTVQIDVEGEGHLYF